MARCVSSTRRLASAIRRIRASPFGDVPSSARNRRLRWPLADTEFGRERAYRATCKIAVVDHADCAHHGLASDRPGGQWTFVLGAAAQAGTVARLHRRRRGREIAHVLLGRRPCRAYRTAKHAGSEHTDDEMAVEAEISREAGASANIRGWQHYATIFHRTADEFAKIGHAAKLLPRRSRVAVLAVLCRLFAGQIRQDRTRGMTLAPAVLWLLFPAGAAHARRGKRTRHRADRDRANGEFHLRHRLAQHPRGGHRRPRVGYRRAVAHLAERDYKLVAALATHYHRTTSAAVCAGTTLPASRSCSRNRR